MEMNNFFSLSPGLDSNVPLGDIDPIDILVQMVHTVWHESIMTVNFEIMHHILLEIVEFLEHLEVLESAMKARKPQKPKKDKSEKKDQSKVNSKKIVKKNKSFKK